MAPTEDDAELPPVAAQSLMPFASLMLLRSTGPTHELAVRLLANRIMQAARKVRAGNKVEILASGLSGASNYRRAVGDDDGIDELWAFVYQVRRDPSWSAESSPYTDTKHELGLIIRRNDLIGVHGAGSLRSKLQRWLDGRVRPPFERVEPAILNGAFLKGEAKGLWLRGAQSPTAGRPDSKQVTGRKVEASLSPFEDGGYALGSARVAYDGPPERALKGMVGATPRNSIVWNKATVSFDEFVAVTTDVLILVEQITASGGGVEQPYRVLAQRATSLAGVFGAFDIVVASPESQPLAPDIDEDVLNAIAVLDDATLVVSGIDGSADFTIDVGRDHGTAGSLRATVVEGRGDFRLNIGLNVDKPASNPEVTREILDALQTSRELLSIYYDSGHVFDGHSIWRRHVGNSPFPNWRWEDFTGYDIHQEKPLKPGKGVNDAAVHAAIGRDGDNSLFAWVVDHYADGWLICDDGQGEVADFVHMSAEGDLTFIHIKKADSMNRRMSAGPYEEVTAQATKNLDHLDQEELYRALESPSFATASWTKGERVADRSEFLEQLRNRPARANKSVVVLQPHVSRVLYDGVKPPGHATQPDVNALRLMQLETLLNASRGAVTGLGADLHVIGSLA